MAFRLAIANLKGGVGKSTTTLFLSEALAVDRQLRVLVIDLDPQSNSSFMLLSRAGVEQAEKMGKLLPQFLLDLGTEKRGTLQLSSYICGRASDVLELHKKGSSGTVDLLASVPKMWFVESLFDRRYYMENSDPAGELRLALTTYLEPLDAFYDLMIFDCPPGFSSLTRAGLLGANAILSPTIADAVSLRSLRDFVELGLGEMLKIKSTVPHFVMVSKYQLQSTDQTEVARLKKSYDVLEPPIRLSKDMTRATDRPRFDAYRAFKEKYGSLAGDVRALADQVYRYVIASRGDKQ